MKSVNKRILAIVISALMILPVLVACGMPTPGQNGTSAGEVVTDRVPSVERKDYNDAEFTAVYCQDIFTPGYYFLEEDERRPGNDMDDKVYERMISVEDHLGVDIIPQNGGGMEQYAVDLKNSVSSGDDTYQMVMTHVYGDVANLIISNYLRDFNEFDSIQLDAEYWSQSVMNALAINDKMYCGYNDFCLANCYVVAFNKDMVKEYPNEIGDLYQQVRDKQWTIDKLIEYTALVSTDDGNGTWGTEDTYGFSTWAWVPLISFQIGCDIPIVKSDDSGLYISPMKDNADKITALDEKIVAFMDQDSTFSWEPTFVDTDCLHITSGRVMFQLLNNFSLVQTTEEDVKVGVLPYPLWDTKQADYKTLSWNGVLGIPTTVQDLDMVGDVYEMLAWYSEPVTTAFYETLLGAKVAEAPEDVEMLEIVWNTQVTDLGLVFSSSSAQLDRILYAIPHHVSIPGTPAYSTYYKQNQRTAEKLLNDMFKD